MSESRTQKTFLNARVNFIFYFLTLVIAFFSRKVFLYNLGDDFIGLTGTLSSILGFLNLAELGISTAIAVILYKPLFDKDTNEINNIISVFGFIYSVIGRIILLLGVVLSLFLPLIFSKTAMPMGIVYFAYYSYLLSSMLSYFVNYKQILLGADQRNYVITAYYQTSAVVKNLLQLALCYYTHNYYVWVAVEICFGILYSYMLDRKIRQVYPWLKPDLKSGRELFKKYPEIVTKTKQVFVQRLSFTVLTQATTPLIYAFSTLQAVTMYGNYMMLIDKGATIINMTFSGVNAGIGNLIAEGNRKHIVSVFWQLRSFRYWMAFSLVFSFYYLIEPFIRLWLGGEYVMSRTMLAIILINVFIGQTRAVVMAFLNGYGLFKDTWSSVVEAVLNIVTAFFMGSHFGMEGVLSGTTVSLLIMICVWKPYFLFKEGFGLPVASYWKRTSVYFIVSGCIWALFHFLAVPLLDLDEIGSFAGIVCAALILVPGYTLLTWAGYYLADEGMRDFSRRIRSFVLHKSGL